mgnify:FL=1
MTLRATVAELRARGIVHEPLAHVSPDAEAARQMAARLQRALDEERRRGHALAEAVRALLRLDAVCVIHDEVGAALEEYDEPAREGAA